MRRIAILLAAVAVSLSLSAVDAFAEATLTVNVVGTGSGEVTNDVGLVFAQEIGVNEGITTPPIECHGPPKTGQCTGLMDEFFAYVGAYPDPGSEFVGWTIEEGMGLNEGCYSPSIAIKEFGVYACEIVAMDESFNFIENAQVTATFEASPSSLLKVSIEEGDGTVVSSPAGIECSGEAVTTCESEFKENSTVVLTASPAPGYLFKSWKKCDKKEGEFGVNGRQCTVKASEAKEVGVNFIKVWDLTVSKAAGSGPGIAKTKPGGIVCLYACATATAAYKDIAAPGGKEVEVAVKPAKHFHFTEFLNGTGQTEACNGHDEAEGCSYEPKGEDSSIEVLVEEDPKNTLSLSKEGGGQVFIKTKPTGILCGYTCSAAEAEFYAADTVLVSVKLNKGTNKLEWTTDAGTCTGTIETAEATCEVPMSEAHELTAKLE